MIVVRLWIKTSNDPTRFLLGSNQEANANNIYAFLSEPI
jgi:hypothetical protein